MKWCCWLLDSSYALCFVHPWNASFNLNMSSLSICNSIYECVCLCVLVCLLCNLWPTLKIQFHSEKSLWFSIHLATLRLQNKSNSIHIIIAKIDSRHQCCHGTFAQADKQLLFSQAIQQQQQHTVQCVLWHSSRALMQMLSAQWSWLFAKSLLLIFPFPY